MQEANSLTWWRRSRWLCDSNWEEPLCLVHMLNNFSSPARIYVHKEHEMLCHNVGCFFPPIKYEECCKWADTAPVINPGDKGDQHAASCLGQVGVYSEQVIQEVNMGVVQIQPILGWNLYLNVIVKNGTTWQSRKDLLPFSVVSANLIPAENINHLQFLRPIFFLTLTINNLLSCCSKKQEENLLLQFGGSAVSKHLKNPDSIFR